MTKLAAYLRKFNEEEVVNAFRPLLVAEGGYNENITFDIVDVELFLSKYCIAFEDGITEMICNEWYKRTSYYESITYEVAKQMAIENLANHFFNDSPTMLKGSSLYASVFDWMDENYKVLSIPTDEYGEEECMLLVMDFSFAPFDVDRFIPHDWYAFNGEYEHFIYNAMEKCNVK